MKREFGVEANIGKPQVAYRETITKDNVEIEGKFVRQSGGRGQFGHCWIRFSAADVDEKGNITEGLVFENEVEMCIRDRSKVGRNLTVMVPG